MVAVGGVAGGGVLHVPVTHTLVGQVVAAHVHHAVFRRRGLPHASGGERVAAPLVRIGQVVGGLEQEAVNVGVRHGAGAHGLARAEAVCLAVRVVSTVGGGEGEAGKDVELQVNVAAGGALLPVVLCAVQIGQRAFLDTVVRVKAVRTVVGEDFHGRRVVQRNPDGVPLVLVKARSLSLTLRQVHVGGEFKPAEEFAVNVHFGRVAFKFGVFDDTLVLHVVSGNIELRFLVSFRDGQFIVLCNAGAEHFV